MVDINQIDPNPHQPRTDFQSDEARAKLEELAQSIREHGLIQPLIVTQGDNGRYTLIAGERRLRAAQLAERAELPVVVKEATPQEMLELAIVENVQRSDLNPLEEALAYQQLKEDFGLTQQEVAGRVGKARSTVANIMRLTDLPDEAKVALLEGHITQRHGRAILDAKLSDEDKLTVLRSVIGNDLTVKKTLDLIRALETKKKRAPKPQTRLPAEFLAVQSGMRDALGAKVELQKNGNRGKVVIHFESIEDLNAIYDKIVGEA